MHGGGGMVLRIINYDGYAVSRGYAYANTGH